MTRPNPSTSALWRSRRRRSVPRALSWPRAFSTWGTITTSKASSRRLRRCWNAPYESAKKSWTEVIRRPRCSADNLAIVYFGQGRYAEAEPLFQQAQHTLERVLGPEHPELATSLNALGAMYHEQGRLAEAEPLLERALGIRETALGPFHPDVAASLRNLEKVLRDQGRYHAAAKPEPGGAELLLRDKIKCSWSIGALRC